MTTVCVQCQQTTSSKCSGCRAYYVCSTKCFRELWPTHKKDCTDLQMAKKLRNTIGLSTPPKGSLPVLLEREDLVTLVDKMQTVEDLLLLNGLQELPTRVTPMTTLDKINLFVGVLQIYDTRKYQDLPLMVKLVLNRQFNNTYRHAIQHLPVSQLAAVDRALGRV